MWGYSASTALSNNQAQPLLVGTNATFNSRSKTNDCQFFEGDV
jgi:hypothetical protein